MNLILFGFKGCGKTTLGKKVAERLHSPFIDTDALLEQLYFTNTGEKLICSDIYRSAGNTAFRALEKQAVKNLTMTEKSIIAVGGGVVLDPENVALLHTLGRMVYLRIDPSILKKRIILSGLPAYLENLESDFEQMYAERKTIYEAIDADWIDVNEHFQDIIATLCSLMQKGVYHGQ